MKKAMKIMAMVLFVMGMTALTSCTKDNSDLILGKWKFDKATMSYGGQTVQLTAADLADMMNFQGSSDEFVVDFKSDGKVYASDEPEPANYTLDGSKLTVFTPEITFRMTITKLTSSTLVVEPEFDDDEMPEGAKAEIRFKKA